MPDLRPPFIKKAEPNSSPSLINQFLELVKKNDHGSIKNLLNSTMSPDKTELANCAAYLVYSLEHNLSIIQGYWNKNLLVEDVSLLNLSRSPIPRELKQLPEPESESKEEKYAHNTGKTGVKGSIDTLVLNLTRCCDEAIKKFVEAKKIFADIRDETFKRVMQQRSKLGLPAIDKEIVCNTFDRAVALRDDAAKTKLIQQELYQGKECDTPLDLLGKYSNGQQVVQAAHNVVVQNIQNLIGLVKTLQSPLVKSLSDIMDKTVVRANNELNNLQHPFNIGMTPKPEAKG